ncbi:MAG: ABC transporter ATP-binding protein [Acidobacteria bacterium]|nr:ABC transporter ATP-binding protein [Acidobacteriota bacterium]
MSNSDRILTYYKRYWGKLLLGCLSVLFTAIFGLLSPKIISLAIDDLQLQITQQKLITYGGLLLGVATLRGIFLYSQRWILVVMSRDIENDLRNDYYDHLQKLSLDFFQQNRVGDLMARATNDLNAVRMLVGPAIMYFLNTIVVSLIAIPVMIAISLKLTVLVVISFLGVAIVTNFFSTQIHNRFEKIQEHFSSITARVQENLTGTRVIRAYVRENYEIEKFGDLNEEFVGRNLGLIKVQALFGPLLRSLVGLGSVLTLWYGGNLVATNAISLGKFVEFNLYLTLLIWPMIALGYVVSLYQRGMASLKRINSILNTEATIKNEPKSTISIIKGTIEFRNLTFSYKEKPVLKNINLKIASGQTIAIVGHTGSGKSTLINLIPRLFQAPKGMLFIDGQDIKDLPLSLLRESIGYVPQDTFLFSDTIAENIAFGVNKTNPQDIEKAAEQAGLLVDIETFPKQFETLVGERGITLSGGQKQRTAIARALIRQPQILILDDSLSAVDTETEERVLGHLKNVMKGRTSIIVSHRISTVKMADLIIVLSDGEIIERGTHESLIAKGGDYAALYEKQLLEEELAAT